MLRTLFLVWWLILLGCSSSVQIDDREGIKKERLANRIFNRVAHKLLAETDMQPCGTIGQMLREIEVLGLAFSYNKPVDIPEARRLLLRSIDSMIQEVNQDNAIHPYLIRFPFAPDHVEMQIFFQRADGREVPAGALTVATFNHGYLHYKIEDPKSESSITVYRETYEEAVARLQDPSLPLVSFQPSAFRLSSEDLAAAKKGIRFLAEDGSLWHFDDEGDWVSDPSPSTIQKNPG